MNRLQDHPNPYLAQHGDNPVDWYPWGEEALAKAKAENKLILVSIGYSTCHWCHVMAHDSFEKEDVAALLNRDYVAIKVDREERPDLDEAYMAVCMAMTGRGGWPLNVFLTPDLKPFHAATFIPREPKYGQPGLLKLLPELARIWREEPERLEHTAGHILQHLAGRSREAEGELVPSLQLDAIDTLMQRKDAEWGGFGGAPKFPSLHQLRLVLRSPDPEAYQHALLTLDRMVCGGIHDHVGGGFHRYATDREWFLPHFEKMLYDQASFVHVFVDAYQRTRDPKYLAVANRVVAYVRRDLTHPSGLAYCAEDADSEGHEGTFYVWDYKALGDLAKPWGAKPKGNWTDEGTAKAMPTNHLYWTGNWDAHTWDAVSKLEPIRAQRVRPHRDEKVLADWNGYWLSAVARLALVAPEHEPYAKQLTIALQQLVTEEGVRHGLGLKDQMLDDVAYVAWGLLEASQLFGREDLLAAAHAALGHWTAFYRDGFRRGARSEAGPIEAVVDGYDGAMPSAPSVLFHVATRLLAKYDDVQDLIDALLDGYQGAWAKHPYAFAMALLGLDGYLRGSVHLELEARIRGVAFPPHALVEVTGRSAYCDVGGCRLDPADVAIERLLSEWVLPEP